jgi:general secretion pathway protein I
MTLIEVLVAFVVLSITMAVILQIFSGGMRNARVSGSYSRAVFLAESRLAGAGVERPLVPGASTGQVGAIFQWRVSVEPIDDSASRVQQAFPVRLYRVSSRVAWSEDGRDRQVELVSIKLGPLQ